VEKNLIVLVGPQGNNLYSEIKEIRKHAFWPVEANEGSLLINGLPSGERELREGYAMESTDLPGGRWALLVLATNEEWMGRAVERLGDFQSPGLYAAIMVTPDETRPLPVLE
jgi:hypothetical protein